jgi:MFS transporter, FHS family, glucose/mannose:H+ symporter
MNEIRKQSCSPPPAARAQAVLYGGIIIAGIITTLLDPVLPILINRWSLSDRRAGLFFTAQFCGSMLGVASMTELIRKGYRTTFVAGFSLMAAGVAGLNFKSVLPCLVTTGLFGLGLGQVLSASNLWVSEVKKARRVAALSVLNLMWGLGAIASAPLVMFAQRNDWTSALFYTIAAFSALTAVTLLAMNMEPAMGTEREACGTSLRTITMKSMISLGALFFLYVGCENSVAGWVASLTKRMSHLSGDLWALTPMFFWAGLLAGRALVPLLPAQNCERALLATSLVFASASIGFLLRMATFATIAIGIAVAGLGFAAVYPIIIAWMVTVFGQRSRRIGGVMFALAAMGGATMPWLVGLVSTKTDSLRAGLLVPLAGCIAMLACMAAMIDATKQHNVQLVEKRSPSR